MSIFSRKQDPKQLQPESRPEEQQVDFDVEDGTVSDGLPRAPYGIADAMRLMRSLPTDQNIDLVVRVVRVTLGSVNVRIEDIIEDANRRQRAIQDNIAALHGQVADLEEELEARRRAIAEQEADFKETSSVKERLLLAEKSANMAGQRITGGAATVSHSGGSDTHQPSQPPPPPARALPKPSPRE